jgi:hypothetical protein
VAAFRLRNMIEGTGGLKRPLGPGGSHDMVEDKSGRMAHSPVPSQQPRRAEAFPTPHAYKESGVEQEASDPAQETSRHLAAHQPLTSWAAHCVRGMLLFPLCFHIRSAGDPGTLLSVPPGCARDTIVRDAAHARALWGIPCFVLMIRASIP